MDNVPQTNWNDAQELSWTHKILSTRATNFLTWKRKNLTLLFTIFTLFWPINFLRLQLQNISSLGVEVNPKAYSYTLSFNIFKNVVV